LKQYLWGTHYALELFWEPVSKIDTICGNIDIPVRETDTSTGQQTHQMLDGDNCQPERKLTAEKGARK
jgi:hypothetical protein